jgi:MoxR-like ATPase
VSAELARQVVEVVQQLRARDDLAKPPGVAETLDWARAITHLGTTQLDLATAAATLGALVKYREDGEKVRHALAQMLRA